MFRMIYSDRSLIIFIQGTNIQKMVKFIVNLNYKYSILIGSYFSQNLNCSILFSPFTRTSLLINCTYNISFLFPPVESYICIYNTCLKHFLLDFNYRLSPQLRYFPLNQNMMRQIKTLSKMVTKLTTNIFQS